MRTLEQKRAENALGRVKELADKLNSQKEKESYRAYVDRLGPTIVMNGLGQALASERAAGGRAHDELYTSLKRWLCGTDGVYPQEEDILDAITKHSESKYIRAQAEALAWLQWHKKFCRASFPKGQDD